MGRAGAEDGQTAVFTSAHRTPLPSSAVADRRPTPTMVDWLLQVHDCMLTDTTGSYVVHFEKICS